MRAPASVYSPRPRFTQRRLSSGAGTDVDHSRVAVAARAITTNAPARPPTPVAVADGLISPTTDPHAGARPPSPADAAPSRAEGSIAPASMITDLRGAIARTNGADAPDQHAGPGATPSTAHPADEHDSAHDGSLDSGLNGNDGPFPRLATPTPSATVSPPLPPVPRPAYVPGPAAHQEPGLAAPPLDAPDGPLPSEAPALPAEPASPEPTSPDHLHAVLAPFFEQQATLLRDLSRSIDTIQQTFTAALVEDDSAAPQPEPGAHQDALGVLVAAASTIENVAQRLHEHLSAGEHPSTADIHIALRGISSDLNELGTLFAGQFDRLAGLLEQRTTPPLVPAAPPLDLDDRAPAHEPTYEPDGGYDPPTRPATSSGGRRRWLIRGGGAAAALALLIGGGIWLFGGSEPPKPAASVRVGDAPPTLEPPRSALTTPVAPPRPALPASTTNLPSMAPPGASLPSMAPSAPASTAAAAPCTPKPFKPASTVTVDDTYLAMLSSRYNVPVDVIKRDNPTLKLPSPPDEGRIINLRVCSTS